jgi:hypothetical protein
MKTVYIVNGPCKGEKIEAPNKLTSFCLAQPDSENKVEYEVWALGTRDGTFRFAFCGAQPKTSEVKDVLREIGVLS